MNLRPIFMTVDFSALPTNADLLEAVCFLQNIFRQEQPFQKVSSEKFPIEFIPDRYKSEYEQNIWNECSRLLTNCIVYYNISILSNLLERKEKTNKESELNDLKQISPIAWQHINFLGRYEFEKLDIPIKIDEIVDKINYQSSRSEN